jgi:enediyne biosynthesis protein E3
MVSGLLAKLRLKMFMPAPSETQMGGKPGWPPAGEAQRAQLERVANNFMEGLRVGLEAVPPKEIEDRLQQIEPEYQGFAYEGCGMGLAVTDSVSLRPHRVREFVETTGIRHEYMIYIGVGWGMARIPKMRWRVVIPKHHSHRYLALDGLGFHQAFFDTERYVTNHYQPKSYPAWPGDRDYAHRAIDQGIGRALWFVNGANPIAVAACINGYPENRRSDLWAGTGLASVYAGGVDLADLARLKDLAGQYRPELAQGAVFAAKTRHMTDLMTPHTEVAVKNHCEMSVAEAAAIMDETQVDLPPDGEVPAYEIWRQRIQRRFR